jgi:hypothetical protein
VIYVRQSTQAQVQLNLESQRRQYELVDVARRWGFRKVEVIDQDLGRTASGAVERHGFERLVDDLCTSQLHRKKEFSLRTVRCRGRDHRRRDDPHPLIETAKLSGLNPRDYLVDVLASINDHIVTSPSGSGGLIWPRAPKAHWGASIPLSWLPTVAPKYCLTG